MVPQKKQTSGTASANRVSKDGTNKSSEKKGATLPVGALDILNRRSELSPTDVILKSMASGVGSTKEIFMTMTDYFDGGIAATPYWVWQYDSSQEILTSGTASTDPYLKLLEASVYALPVFGLDTSSSSILVLTTVPSFDGTQTGDGVAANPQTTLVTPTAQSKWVLVGHYKAKELFSGGLNPQVSSSGNHIVFAGTELDPDTLEKRSADFTIQYKIVCRFAVGLDPITKFKYALDLNDVASSLAFPVAVATTAQNVVGQITGMGNVA